MSELKPDFDEANRVIDEAKESQSSSSTEAEIQFVRVDVEEVQTEEAQTKEVWVEEVLPKMLQSKKLRL